MSDKIYGDRDLMAMDEAGNHYFRHVDHMTRESLHSKSDIAAELGWRDMQIAALQQKLDAVLAENASIKASVAMHAAGFKICPACSHQDECETDDVVWMVKEATPATDALLNAVRAEGVEMFIDELSELFQSLKTGGKPWQAVKGIAMRATSFAAQLRAETDTTSSQYESLAGGK